MSTKAVILWLVAAVVLGIAAIFLLRTPPTNSGIIPQGRKLFAITPPEIRSISIKRADGPTEVIEKETNASSPIMLDSEWQYRVIPASETEYAPPGWPVSSSQMQSLLRIIADLNAIAEPAKDAKLGEKPIKVVIGLMDGTQRSFSLDDRALAGTCLAEVDPVPEVPATAASPARPGTPRALALISSRVHEMLTSPGPKAWRETAVLAALAGDAARFRMENNKQTLVLGRTEGRWALREPVAAPVDQAAMQALVAELGRLHVMDFLDGGVNNVSTGLETPTARLAIEVDRRAIAPGSADPVSSTLKCEIEIGRPADSAGKTVFASINGERVVLLDGAALARLSMDPASYIWPHPTRLASGDIGTIVLNRTDSANTAGSRAFKRSLDRWTQIRADNTEVTLADKDLRDADALVAFLTGGDRGAFKGEPAAANPRAERPTITITPPGDYRPVGHIRLLSLAGEPMDTLEVGVTRPGNAAIRTGAVYREYPIARLPAPLADLINSAPAAAPDAKPEINK